MFLQADATRLPFADDSFDLVFGSPPYMDARTYGIGSGRQCQAWIDWMLAVTAEAVRVSRGLVLWVVGGCTRKHCYQPGCEGLLYEWWKRGGRCWRPAFWHRVGIPGSGGKQWLRADIEYVLAFTKCEARIPWADNTANGHRPKWAPGGEMSHRVGGRIRTQWGGSEKSGNHATKNGDKVSFVRPSHILLSNDKRVNDKKKGQHDDSQATRFLCGEAVRSVQDGSAAKGIDCNTESGIASQAASPSERQVHGAKKITRRCTRGSSGGDTRQNDMYLPPVLANPGVLIKNIKVGGGLMGHKAAHENEAPFPKKLAEWFIRSWCPPGGLVLDPFSGSGTTVDAAITLGRRGVGADLRMSQCVLGAKRCESVQPTMFQ